MIEEGKTIIVFKKSKGFMSEGGRLHSDESYYVLKGVMTKEEALRKTVSWLDISMDTYRYQIDEGNESLIRQVERLIEQGFQVVKPIIKTVDKIPEGYIKVPIKEKYFLLVREIHEEPVLIEKREPSPEEIREMMKELFG